jgi:hypothetical protein
MSCHLSFSVSVCWAVSIVGFFFFSLLFIFAFFFFPLLPSLGSCPLEDVFERPQA